MKERHVHEFNLRDVCKRCGFDRAAWTLIAGGKNIAQRRLSLQRERREISDALRGARKRLQECKSRVDRAASEAVNAESIARAATAVHAKELRHALLKKIAYQRRAIAALQDAERVLLTSLDAICDSRSGTYLPAPPATITPSKEYANVPPAPGVYFLWTGDVCEYVGQASCLSRRLALGSHHVLREHHRISWLLFARSELDWAECYYIGTLRPVLNFGQRAAHKRYSPAPESLPDLESVA